MKNNGAVVENKRRFFSEPIETNSLQNISIEIISKADNVGDK